MSASSDELMAQVKKDHPTYTSETMKSREMLADADPAYLESYNKMYVHVMKERNNLPLKIKEVIVSAVNAATGYERGIRIHLRGALEAGATKDEIIEGLEAASLPAGIHVLSLGLPVLDEVLQEYDAEKKGDQ
jgi:alkylhydroperoxidase/carboxymuconolactone decarboxylase family protein YurZ